MRAPLKISAKVEIDASAAKTGAKQAQGAVSSIGETADLTTTKLQRLIETSTGLHSGAANQNIRQWRGALADEGLALDQLRAKYNPLYAVITRYKESLTEIRTAHAMGALSAEEMTAAITRQRQAALAATAAIKGRNAAFTSGGVQQHAVFNSLAQFQDIGVTAAMGMNPAMIGLQQGSQLALGLQGMGLKQAVGTIGAAFTGLINPVSLAAVGFTTAAAASIQFGSSLLSSGEDVKTLDDALSDHDALLKRVAKSYENLVDKAAEARRENGLLLASLARNDRSDLKRAAAIAGGDFFEQIGTKRVQPRGEGTTFYTDSKFQAFDTPLQRLREQAIAGKPDFEAFFATIEKIAATDPLYRRRADELADLIDGYREANAALKEQDKIVEGLGKRLDGLGRGGGKAFKESMVQARDALRQARLDFDQWQQSLNARSPAEKAAAARAAESLKPLSDDELGHPEVRRARIELAGRRALIEAEKEITDARRERAISLSRSLADQQFELSLIGQSRAEAEALRREYELIEQVKADARKHGLDAEKDAGYAKEIAAIRAQTGLYRELLSDNAAGGILKTQSETNEKLRLQLSLIGQSSTAQARALALYEAEKQLREAGIDAESEKGRLIRQNAALAADMTSELQRQQDAFQSIQQTGQNMIDNMFSKLADGDFKGMLDDLLSDLNHSLLQFGAANPLKNALYGTNLPTMSDAGGIGGFFKTLLGGDMSTASMAVNAGSVIVNGGIGGSSLGGNLTPNISRLLSPANNNGDTASQIWNFFSSKGLKDYQVAAILGHAKAESSFNPLAIGDGGNAAGLFQHNGPRMSGLLNFLGGRSNLGNVTGQLDYVWKELLGSERGSLQSLLRAPDLRSAVAAFGGFERPSGWSAQNPWGMHNASGRFSAAEEALRSFSNQTNTATNNLGMFGNDLGKLGNSLSGAFSRLGSGGGGSGFDLGGLFSNLFSPSFKPNTTLGSLLIKGYAFGGYTGPGGINDPAGVVHKGEIVWNQADIARAGGVATVEAMRLGKRGYARGGVVDASIPYLPANANHRGDTAQPAPVYLNIANHTSGELKDYSERTDERGGRHISFAIAEQVGAAISKKGGGARNTLKNEYALRSIGPQR